MKKCTSFLLLVFYFFTAKSQVLTDSILVENHYRTFHFIKPNHATKNFNLIFVLHGSGGNGKGMLKPAEALQKEAGKEPVFLVYPDGYKRYWNECRKSATSAANQENINEQAFFNGMLQYFAKNYEVNGNRFYAVGLSGGGHMAYKLALTMPATCKGITAIVANLPDQTNMDCAAANKPVPVMIINGTNDAVNPYAGGEMMVNGSSFGQVLSTENTLQYWASLAKYKGVPKEEKMADPNPANKQTITKYTYKKRRKPEVVLLKITGGEHAFPEDVNGFIEAWQFFKRQK